MTSRVDGLALTAASLTAAIVCAALDRPGWAYALGIVGLAAAAATAFGRPDKRDEERARIGEGDA